MMLPIKRRSQFTPPPTALERQLVPLASTMAGSLVSLAPVVLTEPLLPPFGFLVLIGWRLLRGGIWPVWIGLPLGLWDDLFSGQPIGSAMFSWTLAMLALDAFDRRLPFRDHRQDWAIAVLATAGVLLADWLIVGATGGLTSPLVMVPQLALSALIYPLIARGCGSLDRWRNGR